MSARVFVVLTRWNGVSENIIQQTSLYYTWKKIINLMYVVGINSGYHGRRFRISSMQSHMTIQLLHTQNYFISLKGRLAYILSIIDSSENRLCIFFIVCWNILYREHDVQKCVPVSSIGCRQKGVSTLFPFGLLNDLSQA